MNHPSEPFDQLSLANQATLERSFGEMTVSSPNNRMAKHAPISSSSPHSCSASPSSKCVDHRAAISSALSQALRDRNHQKSLTEPPQPPVELIQPPKPPDALSPNHRPDQTHSLPSENTNGFNHNHPFELSVPSPSMTSSLCEQFPRSWTDVCTPGWSSPMEDQPTSVFQLETTFSHPPQRSGYPSASGPNLFRCQSDSILHRYPKALTQMQDLSTFLCQIEQPTLSPDSTVTRTTSTTTTTTTSSGAAGPSRSSQGLLQLTAPTCVTANSRTSSISTINSVPPGTGLYAGLDGSGISSMESISGARPQMMSNSSAYGSGIAIPPAKASSAVFQQAQASQASQAAMKSIDSTRYKISLCRAFERDGVCPYGDVCIYAHGPKELRSVTENASAVHSLTVLVEQLKAKMGPIPLSALGPVRYRKKKQSRNGTNKHNMARPSANGHRNGCGGGGPSL